MPDDGLWRGWERPADVGPPRAQPPRWRTAAAAALAFVALVAGLAAVLRDEQRPAGPARTTLLDALSPVLSTGAPSGEAEDAAARLGVPLDRAAAQLFLVGFAGTGESAPFLRRLRVRDWGGVVLTSGNWTGSRRRLAQLTGALRRTARRAGHTPPVVAALAPGGDRNAITGAGPPSPAAVPGAAEAEDTARAAGAFLRRLGVDAVLGPPASRALAGGAWEDRGFGEDPELVAQRAGAAVRGWQSAGVVAIPGRFPGEGAASQDPADGPATVALARPDLEADLRPFRALAPRVVATQMSGAFYAAFDGVTPATLLPGAVALLRRTDPDAVVVSADLQAVTLTTGGTVADAAVEALRAGCDLLYVPGDAADQEAAFRAVVRAIRSGAVPGDRVADALGKAAALKRAAGVVRR